MTDKQITVKVTLELDQKWASNLSPEEIVEHVRESEQQPWLQGPGQEVQHRCWQSRKAVEGTAAGGHTTSLPVSSPAWRPPVVKATGQLALRASSANGRVPCCANGMNS